MTVLSVEDVSLRLASKQILDQVTFQVQEGQFTGLIGSNGAGKTTLLRVILGLESLQTGTLSLDRKSVGYVPQKFLLDPDLPLRARDLVALGITPHRLGFPLPSRQRQEQVDRALEAVNATQFAHRRVGLLSGGEQQRILIAHALIGHPKLLILDEPLANLDLRSGQEVTSLLAQLAQQYQMAVLLSAHEMNHLLPLMDQIVYMTEGRAASGTIEQVVRSEVLSTLYGTHVDVLNVHGRVIVVASGGQRTSHGLEDIEVVS